jgi:glycosyltransferase involved in cell wall biosynthesis
MENTYDTIIGVSKSVAEGLNRQIKHKDITYIDNAICFSRLDTYEKISLRDNENQKVVLMAGWPALVKGVDIAAQAILELRNDGCDIKLCIMQSGDFEQTQHCVTEAIGSYPDWVKILPPREDVATYYNAADIFLSASRTEGLSYAIIEASYSSAMVCCSNLQGNSLDIPNNKVFVVNDIDGCYEALYNILNLSLKEKISYKTITRDFILKRYSMDGWVKEVVKLYE